MWRVLRDYPDYRVSDQGEVESKRRNNRWNPHSEWKPLKPRPVKITKDGNLDYLRVAIYNNHGRRDVSIHVLVLETFIGPRPKGMQGCHNNGNHKDNRLSNLRWDTASGNQKDRKDVGGNCRRGHPRSRRPDRHCLECRREKYHAAKS